MAEKKESGGALPWSAVVVLVTAAAGAYLLNSSLTSSRPPSESRPTVESLGENDVDARLWQDPFGASHAHRRAIKKESEGAASATDESGNRGGLSQVFSFPLLKYFLGKFDDAKTEPRDQQVHSWKSLAEQITASRGEGRHVLILAVMVNSGPYSEYTEGRLRARQAVLSGLATSRVRTSDGHLSQFKPVDGEHIGYVEVPWYWRRVEWRKPLMGFSRTPWDQLSEARNGLSPYATRLVVPYEWCKPVQGGLKGEANPQTRPAETRPAETRPAETRPAETRPAETRPCESAPPPKGPGATPDPIDSVLVLWLSEEAFVDAPLTRLAWLTDLLQPEGAQGGPVLLKLLGPKTSTGLRAMVEEASHGMTGDAARILSGCEIYAATATAPEEVLLRGPLPGTRQPEFGTRVADFVEGAWRAGPGARLFRTIHPDDRLLTELVGELERRDIHVRPPGAGGHTLPDHVAIVTEWDTLYGRSLARAFIAEVMGKRACEISEQAFACGIGLPGNVTFHSYLRGIDGQLPGESAAAPDSSKGLESEGNSNKGEKPSKAPAENAPTERTEGLNQGDYLRRLAAELGQLDIRLRRDEGKGIRAVGVLGTDLYDKLEVMTALRAVLPQAQFFTTDLDARLALPAEWPAAHNLIVGSSYGLTLHPGYQAEIPPFRDVYQTSMYAATLAATGWLKDLPGKMQSPRLFEIGRRGAHDLTVVPRDQACVASDPKYSVQPTRPDFRGWWTTHIIWNFWPAVAGGAMFFIWPLAFAFSRNRATIIRLVASVAPQTLAAMALFIGGASLLWECWGANDWAYAQKAAAAALLGYLAIHVAGMGTAQALRKQPPGGVLWVTSGYVLGFLATTVWRSGGQGADRLVIRGVAALSVVGLLAWAAAGAGLVLRRWVRRRARRTRRRLGPAGGRAAWNFHPPWGSCWWLWRRGARLAYPALACLTFVVPVLVLPRLPLARVIEKVAGEPVGVSPGLSFAVPAFASIILFAAAGVVLCLAALWVARGTGFKLHRLATKTPPFAIIVGGLVVTVIWLLYRVQRVSGEPFALFEGLSVWPTEALRLVACALCVQFLLKAYYDTRSNDCDIASKFGLSGASAWEREGAAPGAGRDRGWWGRFFRKVSLLSWDVAAAPRRARPGQQEAEGCEIDVEKLWREYHRSGSLGPRLWRFVPVAAAYFVTFFFVFRMSGGGSSPCRGKLCHNFDLFVTFVLMIPLYMTLTFFVVDGSLLNYRFITSLAARPTRWPAAAYTQCRGLGMPNDLIGDYLDIRLIAGRTKVVGELVYYPFLVLFLLVVSRNSYFANWNWPATLVVMFALNAAGAVACAYGLRKSAEAARDKAIRNLREKAARSTWEGQTQSAAAIRLLVEEVEAEREGAFSILSQHPILAAIILPSGSVGAWVLIEYLGRTMH